MGTDQEVIDALQIIKDAYCGVESPARDGIKQIVGDTSGELSQQQKDDIAPLLAAGKGKTTKILSETESPYYDPTDAGSGYTPKTWTGGTDTLIAGGCQEACDALDEYVACNDDTSGQHLRHTRDAIEAFEESGGI